MNILIVTGIFPPDIGGPATYVPFIAEKLQKKGHHITVVTTAEPDYFLKPLEFPFKITRLNRRRNFLLRTIHYMWNVVKEGRKAEVIYANGIFLEVALANVFLRKRLIMKIVGDPAWERATNRGWTQEQFNEFQKNSHYGILGISKWLRSFGVKCAHTIIVPSKFLKKTVSAWGVREDRIRVVYNSAHASSNEEPRSHALQTSYTVLTVGRLVEWKHVDLLLKAIKDLPEVGLTIVGDGPKRSELEILTKELQIEDRVSFAGAMSAKEVRGLMKSADLFVLNSSYEGLPHVILEAMESEMKIVATDAGGTAEVLGSYPKGRLVPIGDMICLKEAIQEMLQKNFVDDNSWKEQLAHFTEEKMLSDTYKILNA